MTIAAGSAAAALLLTHTLWRFIQYTPFLFGFAAAVFSTWMGGRKAGLLTVGFCVAAFIWFPPPLPREGLARFLLGFAAVSGGFSWLMARRYEIEDELRASKESIGRSEQRRQAIIDAEPACVKLVSRDGLLLDMNAAGLDMVDASDLSQLLGRRITDLVHPADRDRYLEKHHDVIQGTHGRLEFRLIGLKGRERWVDSRSVPFETAANGSGPQRAVLSVTSDVTDRKRLETELRHAQQMEAIGRLAGGIAHDFNNLLTAIGGFTDLVLGTLDEADPRRANLVEVQKGTMRAAALTHQLLAFSRRQILQPKVLDLNALVADVEKLLHRTIGADVELILNLDPMVTPIRADPGQLEQVLLNLAVNARDAMPNGGQLRFVTEMVDLDDAAAGQRPPMRPGQYVRLTVSDTGTGIAPEVAPHVFEPFFTTKDPDKGTGLGLATVYGIVKQSGGYVWLSSQVGEGSSFEIYFPPAHGDIEQWVRTEPETTVKGGPETILLAEDDGAVRRLTATALRQYGYTVLEARDGEDALRLARTDPSADIHLLITDIVMPGLSGRDLAAQLQAERPGMRVLYTSGYAETITARSDVAPDHWVLVKPFLPNDLARVVRERLDGPVSSGARTGDVARRSDWAQGL